jgi:hypothetical protein
MSLGHGASVVKDGLVLHLDAANVKSYPGSGTVWKDLSGNGNHAQINNYSNTPTFSNSFLGTFDFSNNAQFYIDIPELNNTDPYTVIWFGADGSGNNYSGVSRDVAWRTGNHLIGWQTGAINSDTGRDTNTNTTGDEFMICHVNNTATNTVSQYLNSIFYGTFTYSSWTSVLRWTFGARGDGNGHQYTGKMGAVLLYNRILTEPEIKQNFNATKGRYGI